MTALSFYLRRNSSIFFYAAIWSDLMPFKARLTTIETIFEVLHDGGHNDVVSGADIKVRNLVFTSLGWAMKLTRYLRLGQVVVTCILATNIPPED